MIMLGVYYVNVTISYGRFLKSKQQFGMPHMRIQPLSVNARRPDQYGGLNGKSSHIVAY